MSFCPNEIHCNRHYNCQQNAENSKKPSSETPDFWPLNVS